MYVTKVSREKICAISTPQKLTRSGATHPTDYSLNTITRRELRKWQYDLRLADGGRGSYCDDGPLPGKTITMRGKKVVTSSHRLVAPEGGLMLAFRW